MTEACNCSCRLYTIVFLAILGGFAIGRLSHTLTALVPQDTITWALSNVTSVIPGGSATEGEREQDAGSRRKERTAPHMYDRSRFPRWERDEISLYHAKSSQIFPPIDVPIERSSSAFRHQTVQTRNVSDGSANQSGVPAQTDSVDPPFLADGTIIVRSSGEMGNALHHIANARALQLWAYQVYNMRTRIVLKPQILSSGRINSGKTSSNEKNIHQCFTQTRDWDFWEGLDDNLQQRLKDQNSPPYRDTVVFPDMLSLVNNHNNATSVWKGMDHFYNLSLNMDWRRELILKARQPATDGLTEADIIASDPFPPPILVYTNMNIGKTLANYYHPIRTLLAFDYEAVQTVQKRDGTNETKTCCAAKPDPDESVMHFRNFQTEMRRAKALGFEELSPERTANELFGHLNAGDKLAITTRTYGNNNNTALKDLVRAFEDKGIRVRVIGNHSAVQDLCFLAHTQKELVGSLKSTYFIWGGLLSNVSTVVGYLFNGSSTRARHGGQLSQFVYSVLPLIDGETDPDVLDRFKIRVFQEVAE